MVLHKAASNLPFRSMAQCLRHRRPPFIVNNYRVTLEPSREKCKIIGAEFSFPDVTGIVSALLAAAAVHVTSAVDALYDMSLRGGTFCGCGKDFLSDWTKMCLTWRQIELRGKIRPVELQPHPGWIRQERNRGEWT